MLMSYLTKAFHGDNYYSSIASHTNRMDPGFLNGGGGGRGLGFVNGGGGYVFHNLFLSMKAMSREGVNKVALFLYFLMYFYKGSRFILWWC